MIEKFIPKEMVTTSTYKRTSIICKCGEELNVSYDEPLSKVTWCVDCNRYYERRNDHYIITGYKCFECQTQHKILFIGFDKYGNRANICESCLEKELGSKKVTLEKLKEEISILKRKEEYKGNEENDY